MAKRTQTDSRTTNPTDFFPTPREAVLPLLAHLKPGTVFVEPCAGDYALAGVLEEHGHQCVGAYDLLPRSPFVDPGNGALLPTDPAVTIITNPPFAWPLLEPLLLHWIGAAPAWLLLPADMLFNQRFNAYARHVSQVLPLGRISWMGNGVGGFENFMWAHFSMARNSFILERKRK